MKETRTRFAPSPTGALHAGTVRTALFAWLVAKHDQGKFILRIEDTDQTRAVKGAEQNIFDSLKFLGLYWDQGPGKDEMYGPYFQSQRLDIYKEWAKKLIDAGRAYADPNSEADLQKMRDKAKAASKPFLFREHRPENLPEWDGTQPLRFKSDPKPYKWHDAVMGEMHSSEEAVDDFIIIKSDGFPTYNFAHIVDDFLMQISHVIRSTEFVSSIPRFLNLYEALNIPVPIMATVPQVLNDSGKGKLSKREGAKQVLEYKKQGILPEALVNFLATLGWNDGTTQEIFTVKELVEKFDLSRVQKSGAKFDADRLLWMNGHFIRQLDLDDLYNRTKDYWPKSSDKFDDEYKMKTLALVKDRLKYFEEIPNLTELFFSDLPVNLDLISASPKLKQLNKEDLVKLLSVSKESLENSDFKLNDLNDRLNDLLKSTEQVPAVLFSLIRIATTNAPSSPGLADTLEVLGKETSLRRIDDFLEKLSAS